MNEDFKLVPQAPLSVSNNSIDKKINAITPNEEYVPSTGRQLLGMGIEIGGGMISELSAPLNLIPVVGTGAYLGVKYSMGVGSSYVAQFAEGHPEFRHGRAQFAGGANLVPFGSSVRKTKDGVKLFSKVMAGRATKTALKGSLISTASITGERVIDDGRLPTLEELGFAAGFGGILGAGFDIGSVKVGEKFLPVWDKMTDGMKGTFLKVAGKSPQEIREQITKGKISREEFRTLRDQLVDDAYKDAGFFDGFMGNKKIDVNSLKPTQRLDYVKNRLQYLDELNEDIIDNLEDGIIDAKQFRAQTKPINAEMRALRLREEELTKLARETPTVKPEAERPVSPEEVIEEAVDEIDEPAPRQTLEAEGTATPKPEEREVFNEDGSFNFDEDAPIQPSEPQPEIKIDPQEAPVTPQEKLDYGFAVDDLANELYTKATGKKYTFKTGDRELYLKMEAEAETILKKQQAQDAPATPKETPEPTPKSRYEKPSDVPKYYEDIPTDDYVKGKIRQSEEKGLNEFGMVDQSSVTGGIDTIRLPLSQIENLRGRMGEHEIVNTKLSYDSKGKAKVDSLAKELVRDGKFKKKPLIGIFYDGRPQVIEGNHRIAAAIQEGIPIDVEIRYFDGSNYYAKEGFKPTELGNMALDASSPAKKGTAPSPEPTEKERIIELAEQLMGRKDILDADGNKIGLTSRVASQKTEELVDSFKAYRSKVVDALKQRTEGGDYDADELIKLLDDYAEIAPAKFEVDNKDGNVLRVRGEGATSDEVQEVISKRKQDELDAIFALRDAVKRDRDEPLDIDNLESLRKRIMGETDDEIPTTGSTEGSGNKPKPTSQERRTASLEKQLAREQEIFTGQRDPSDPKAPVTSPRIRELEAQIKFYRTASNEAAEVAELQEKNKLLLALVSGQDVAKIDENLGIHPKFRPDYTKKEKMDGHLEFLRQQNKRLQEEARKVQRDTALAQADRVLNPDLYATSKLDRGIAKFEEITTGLLLDSPLTGTAGLLSNTVAMLTRPLRDTVGGYMWRSLPLKEKRIYRQALYRFANIIAYKDIVTGFFDVSNVSNMISAGMNRGQNPMFPQSRVRLDETTQEPRLKNQREIDKARERQKRRDEGNGLDNALFRIKAAEKTGDVVMELILFGRTMLGGIDVPFANAITKSRLYAEALRDAIRNEAPDIQAHVTKYMEEAYTVRNGRKVWAYKERDLDIINEYREALLMPRDLKKGDIRKTVMEGVTEAVDAQTGAGNIFGRVIQLMFPVRTTGSIATGLIFNTVAAVPVAAGRFVAKGLARLSPDSKLVSGTRAGIVAQTQNNVNRYRKIIREGVDDKGVTLTKESKAQIQNQLNVEETRLAKLKTQMEEVDRKTIGNVLMFAAYFITAWNLIDEDEEEGITGSGAHFDRNQRKDSNFQPYKFIYDDGKSMVDYRMADPDKALLAFVADLKAYYVAKKNNEIPEDSTQSLTKTIRRSAFQILTDNPYMTGARNVSTLMNAETDDDRLLRVFVSLMTSRFSPPSFVRHINQLDDVYVPDNLQSKPKDMMVDKMFGLEPANVRRYETGAPMYLPEKDIWNLIIRSARTRKRAMSYQEVYDILETDGRRTNIVGSLAPTQDGIKTKDYWNEDGQTLYDAFGEFIYNYMPTKSIEVGDKTYRNLRLEEVMYDIITDPSWDEKYNDGKIINVKTDGYVYPDELFDAKDNLKNVSGQSNEGLEELQRVRLAYIRAANAEFFKRDTLKNFKNSSGLTPQEQIAETANRTTD